jgi:hypothetical protein
MASTGHGSTNPQCRLAVGAFDVNTDHVVGPNPNTEIFRADNTWDWDTKLLASYNFKGDVRCRRTSIIRAAKYARQVPGRRPFRRSH